MNWASRFWLGLGALMCVLSAARGADVPAHAVFGFESIKGETAGLDAGEMMLGEFNCIACHSAPPQTTARLFAKPAPLLGGLSRRLRPEYVRAFLADPQHAKSGTPMPDLLSSMPENQRAQAADAIAEFLMSQSTKAGPPEMPIGVNDAERGKALYHTVGCIACHEPMIRPPGQAEPDKPAQRKPAAPAAETASVPLGDLKAKYTASGLAQFLADPLKVRPGGRMPSSNLSAGEARAIAAYLVGGTGALDAAKVDESTLQPGLDYWYFEGPFQELPAFESLSPKAAGTADKVTINVRKRDNQFAILFAGYIKIETDGLYSFITQSDDGSKVWVDGIEVVDNDKIHAPAEKKGSLELKKGMHAIRIGFFQDHGGIVLGVFYQGPQIKRQIIPPEVLFRNGRGEQPVNVDLAKAEKGRKLFASVGCSSCHQLGGDAPAIASELKAPALGKLSGRVGEGCLAASPKAGIPRFALSESQRNTIRATLTNVAKLETPLSPALRVARAMATLNCYACHRRNETGGPDSLRAKYFTIVDNIDLGDEGRFPPHLNGIGGKLSKDWLANVLTGRGAVRPYMATRMPQFGASNVGDLPQLFEKLDAGTLADSVPKPDAAAALDGRKLIGTDGGLSCISCHNIAGQKSLGVPAIDLAQMTNRLRYDWFEKYMRDPASLRPGTRMPMFFDKGLSPVKDLQGGDVARQLAAMWMYMSKATSMPPPPGIVSSDQYELNVGAEPVIFRTFFNSAGKRAIAVGYPSLSHVVFDAEECRMAIAWRGKFLSARPVWDGRGGGATGPSSADQFQFPPGLAVAMMPAGNQLWPKETGTAAGAVFKGYWLDEKRQPVFVYEQNGTVIHEQAVGANINGNLGVVRRFAVFGNNPGGGLVAHLATGKIIEKKGETWLVDGKVTVRTRTGNALVREWGGMKHLLIPVGVAGPKVPAMENPVIDPKRWVEVEVTW